MSTISRSAAVAVYCGSMSGAQPAYTNAAISLGKALAKAERKLVYGGGVNGMMGAVSKSVLINGGSVTGVVPKAIASGGGEGGRKKLQGHEGLTDEQTAKVEQILVDSMHERKVEMARRAGGFVGLPGGFGTFEEVLEVATWTQLGIHAKPVVVLNVRGFYESLRQLIAKGVEDEFIMSINQNIIIFVDGPSSFDEHDDFDWGSACLRALDSWKGDGIAPLFNWSSAGVPEDDKLKAT